MEEQELVTLNGKITHVLFHNEGNFYTVAKFKVNDELEHNIVITGILPNIERDILINIHGTYIEHPKYGMQFKVETYDKPLPTSREGIIRYLSSVQFRNIGKKTAEKVVSALGEDCLEELKQDPTALRQVPGLSDVQIEALEEGLKQSDDGLEELVKFMNIHGIGVRNLVRLSQTYGTDALSKIKENPYRVIEECDGFGFITADKIAMSLGFEKDDPRRLYAYLVSLVMSLCMSSGNSFVRLENLEAEYTKRTKEVESDFSDLLQEALNKHTLVKEENHIYPVSQYEAEEMITKYLSEFPYLPLEKCDDTLMHNYLNDLQKDLGITYDVSQIKAIKIFFDSPVMILTGGPGTGKTTVVRALVTLFHMLYPNSDILCTAPTGRAAKRLAELTGISSTTIHSLLKWDLESNKFGKNEEDPIIGDLLIIDEFSMVDAYLFANLLKASHNVRKICIIGDEDQLPSVGPGSVLRDLISSNVFPLIRLNHIYRQKDGSDVISLAHAIREGDVDLDAYKGDVAFFDAQPSEIKSQVVSIVQQALEKGYSIDDIQVLSPMYAGNAGIDILNNALQETVNPKNAFKREVKNGYMTFREDDKILQLKNQPDDEVYNGDIGRLVEIVTAKESENHKPSIVVDFQGVIVEYAQENWDHITLAYCISVHKSQGSEYPIIIMPFVPQHRIMMQRKLIYTGVTRAKKALVLLGDRDVFLQGISVLDRHPRETALAQKLENAIEKQAE